MKGWVKFHRRYLDSDLWLSEVFTKGQAWVDLFSLANHKDKTIWIRGIEIKIKRGQLAWSEVSLSKRWKWSRNKVRRFLKWLKMKQQIKQQNSNVTTLISILNYELYQCDETPNETPNGTPERQQKDTKRNTNKNVENEKNENKRKKIKKKPNFVEYLKEQIIQNNFIETKDKIFEFYNWRMTSRIKGKKQPYESEKGINGLFRNLNGCRDAGLVVSTCIEIAMEKPWLTPDPSYFKNNGSNNKPLVSAGDIWLEQKKKEMEAEK